MTPEQKIKHAILNIVARWADEPEPVVTAAVMAVPGSGSGRVRCRFCKFVEIRRRVRRFVQHLREA